MSQELQGLVTDHPRHLWQKQHQILLENASSFIGASTVNSVPKFGSFKDLETWVHQNESETSAVVDFFHSEEKSLLMRNLYLFFDLHILLGPHINGWEKPLCWQLLGILAWDVSPERNKLFTRMLEALDIMHDYIVTIVEAMQSGSHNVENLLHVVYKTMMDFDRSVAAHVYAAGEGSMYLCELDFDVADWHRWFRTRVGKSGGFLGV